MKRTACVCTLLGLVAGSSALLAAASAPILPCPPLPNQVSITVDAKVSFDAAANLYTYSYTVTSHPDSVQEIEEFAVAFAPPLVVQISSPYGWSGNIMHERNVVMWRALLVEDPDRIPPDASVPPSIVAIKPGGSLGGFAFRSPKPPGPVKYYVTGENPVPPPPEDLSDRDAEEIYERLFEQCPGLGLPLLDVALTGTTLGPSDARAVTIDIKPGSDPNAINPRSQGVVPVAILGAAGFDVRQVEVASLRLGPGEAAARQREGRYEDLNRDGLLDLILHFPTPAIGLRCWDTALFLTGRLRDGTAIVGSDAVVAAGCK